MSSFLRTHGLYISWISPGQNIGVGSCSLLQGVFLTQGLNPGLPHCRWILYQLSHQGSLYIIYMLYCIFFNEYTVSSASLVIQTVRNLPGMQEIQVRSLVWEDRLEKGMAIHSNILAWRTPWTEEPGGLQSVGSQRAGHN